MLHPKEAESASFDCFLTKNRLTEEAESASFDSPARIGLKVRASDDRHACVWTPDEIGTQIGTVESEVDEGSENRSVVGQFAARALEKKHYVTAEGTAAADAKFGTEVRTVEEASRRPTWAQVAMRGSVRATTENKRVVSRSLS